MGSLRGAAESYLASVGKPHERRAAMRLAEDVLAACDELVIDGAEGAEGGS
ncbi:MAG: hypothetical protein MUE69_29140 [Myxococcota bacterium]|nr:hypothetical protein [Myxococcota bacterium]